MARSVPVLGVYHRVGCLRLDSTQCLHDDNKTEQVSRPVTPQLLHPCLYAAARAPWLRSVLVEVPDGAMGRTDNVSVDAKV